MHSQIASFLLPCTFLHLEIVYWSKLIFATILILVQKDIILSDQISDQAGGHFGHGWCWSVRFFLWDIDYISLNFSQTSSDVVFLLIVIMEVVIVVMVFSLVMTIVAVVIVQGSSYKLHLYRVFPGSLEVVRGSALLDERVVSRRNWYLLLTSASNKRYPETPLTPKHKFNWYLLLTSASNKRYPETPLTLKHKWYLTWPQVVIEKIFFYVASCLTCWMGEGRGEGRGLDMVGQDRRGIQGGAQAHSLIAAVRPRIPD